MLFLLGACVRVRVSVFFVCLFCVCRFDILSFSFCCTRSFTLASILRCHCSYLICCFIVIYAKLDERKRRRRRWQHKEGTGWITKKNAQNEDSERISWLSLPPPFGVSCKLDCKVHSTSRRSSRSSGGIDFSSLCFCFASENPALYIWMCTMYMH